MENVNQPIYYVPYVRFTKTYKPQFGEELKEDSEYPISNDTCSINFNVDEVAIMVQSSYACNIHLIPVDKVELFVKCVIPEYEVGQVVQNIKGNASPYRIWRYGLVQGKIWYRDGWSITTGCESGRHEDKIMLTAEDDIETQESIKYYDDLVKEKYPSIYNAVMSDIEK